MSAGGMPVTLEARERLRDQQRLEAQQLEAVLAAQRRLAARREKADRAIAKIEQTVTIKQADVDSTVAGLVEISGLARAALLLGRTETDLGRTCRAGRRRATPQRPDVTASTDVPA